MKRKMYRLLVISIICFAFLCGCSSSKINRATTLMEEGNYTDAAGLLETISNNDEASNLLDECKYELGLSEIASENWEMALSYFNDMTDPSQSSELISQCNYELGVAAMNNGEWDNAISYFSLSDFKDSNELVAQCEKEKGMREMDDYDFLEALEESVVERMQVTKPADGEYDYSNLVNTELVRLQEFEDASFYDTELESIAHEYLDGLYMQRNSAQVTNWFADEQIMWQEGLVKRHSALKKLYDNYGFLKDNVEFVSTYIAEFEHQKSIAEAYKETEADLTSQVGENSENLQAAMYAYNNSIVLTFTNNTEHTYSLGCEFYFYNANGAMFETTYTTTGLIKPGNAFTITGYVSDVYKVHGFEFETLYVSMNP